MARQPKTRNPKQQKAPPPPARYRPPESLDGVVDELVRRFATEEDSTAHASAGSALTDRARTAPLLERLRSLVPAGTSVPKENPGKSPRGVRPGSPAPWAAQPAELLDEIQRGALDLSQHARRVIGMGPLTVPYVVTPAPAVSGPAHPQCEHVSCSAIRPRTVRVLADLDPARGGRAALLDVVRLLPALAAADSTHHLVAGDRVGQPGEVEQQLRKWHHRALLLTGHAVAWPRLGEIPNPQRDAARSIGPAHLRCAHESCVVIRIGRPRKWIQARCPYCASPSLRQNPETEAIVCTRPSCRDGQGRPNEWSKYELRRLGLILEVTP